MPIITRTNGVIDEYTSSCQACMHAHVWIMFVWVCMCCAVCAHRNSIIPNCYVDSDTHVCFVIFIISCWRWMHINFNFDLHYYYYLSIDWSNEIIAFIYIYIVYYDNIIILILLCICSSTSWCIRLIGFKQEYRMCAVIQEIKWILRDVALK